MEYSNSQAIQAIEEYCHSERDRAILRRRLVDGVKIEHLAEEFDLSPRQIKNILYRNEEILFRHISCP